MIPRFKPTIAANEIIAAFSFFSTNDIRQLEEVFAATMKQKYAIAFPYGRTAIIALLQTLNIVKRDVICPAYTCVVVPHAIITSGNRPLFIDITSDGNMDLKKAQKKITKTTGAIIATSLFGQPVNLDYIKNIQETYPDLPIIQDCAHSFSAEWKGIPVNKTGIAAVFGLNVSKIVTSIFGGMIVTDDKKLEEKLRFQRDNMLKPADWKKSFSRLLYLLAVKAAFTRIGCSLVHNLQKYKILDSFITYYNEKTIDMPQDYLIAMTSCEARVGLINLMRYDEMIKARRFYVNFYRDKLKDISAIKFLPDIPGSTFSQIVARIANRKEVIKKAAEHGVQLGHVLEYSIPEMPTYRDICKNDGPWPLSSIFAKQVINLPVAGVINEKMALKVVTILRNILSTEKALKDVF